MSHPPQPSRAITNADGQDPIQRFPTHFLFLVQDLANQGSELDEWTILRAQETALDEQGMTVEVVLLNRTEVSDLRTWTITVAHRKLVTITCRVAGPPPTSPAHGLPKMAKPPMDIGADW